MIGCQPASLRLSTLSAALLCLCLASAPARPARADGAAWLGASAANLNDLDGGAGLWGPGAQLGFQWLFGQFWGAFADLSASYHFPKPNDEIPAARVSVFSAGLRYNLDVFTYVPYAGLGVTGYLNRPVTSDGVLETNVGLKLVLGVDWRFSRSWSLGFHAELHGLTGDHPFYSQVGFDLAFHFRL